MLTENQKERLKQQGKRNCDTRHDNIHGTMALDNLIAVLKQENPTAFLAPEQLSQRKFFHQPAARVPCYYFLIPCPSEKREAAAHE